MNFDKNIYSKDKINEMIFDKSLLNDYQKMVDGRYALIGGISLIISIIVIGIPLIMSLYVSYKSYSNDELIFENFLMQIVLIALAGVFLFIVTMIIVGFFVGKFSGKLMTFKEYSEPILLGYELALKRFEVENKVQDYEFMFNNKEFFHGLRIIKDLLNTRQMELSNEIAYIPIEKRNRENEIYQTILERKLENQRQMDWLENQLNNLSK
jgi:hypothetical protein